ncbi:MAG: hypothetical protein AUJ52_09685 [Elusimicrobia bacterium CG1_02_63_36]|nr:MAG: hypothetical protein AUJ52_09685 [Elusimicrobia bacterium CG1_02_63_36]PJA13105.1 MAG: hypothetical protein COX66_15555 [Elusimicrobia bacterium CG_4_10_14_0_2_um_filter_63_34]PJB26030.1 MAG: hypothetical protein CO113_05310 [Elusimicrobia bacterium CG_4_9_14_3_um_filter_62_55]
MSTRVGVGLSRLRDSRSAAREAAREAKRTVSEPSLAFAFAGIKHDQKEIHAGLSAELDLRIVLGGSSYAEVTNLGVTKDSVIVLLIRLDGSTLRTASRDLGESSVENGAAFAEALELNAGSGASSDRIPLGFYFGSIIDGKENRMLARMREACPGLPFFGGLCVGDYDLGMSHPDFWTNHQYFPDGVRQKGGRAAVWDLPRAGNKIAFAYDHGWEAVGPVVEFTRTEGEYAYEVDGVPIFDFYRQFLGPQDAGKFFEQMIQRYGFAVVMGPEDGPRPSVLRLPVQCDFVRGRIRFFPAEDLSGRKVPLIQANRHGLIDGARRAVRANVGSSQRREYTYIGDAVNLAQRLESNCVPGRLLLSEGVYREAGVPFSSAERKEITVKGKSAPVVVYDCSL